MVLIFIPRSINQLLNAITGKDEFTPGRQRSVCRIEHTKRIHKKIQRSPQCSANKKAAEGNMNPRTIQIIINEDLRFHLYRKCKVPDLIAA